MDGSRAMRPWQRGRRWLLTAVVAALAVLVILWGLASLRAGATTESAGAPAPAPAARPSAHASVSEAPAVGREALTRGPAGDPQRVIVVSTSGRTLVDAELVPSRLDGDGVLAPPFGVAGWYAESGWAKPGWPGSAILAGHVNRRSPALELDTFGHLPEVRPGDRITVVYDSGESTTFTATASRGLSKKAVPQDDSIWDATNPHPVLRLITCDPSTPVRDGHLVGNWVVWAALA